MSRAPTDATPVQVMRGPFYAYAHSSSAAATQECYYSGSMAKRPCSGNRDQAVDSNSLNQAPTLSDTNTGGPTGCHFPPVEHGLYSRHPRCPSAVANRGVSATDPTLAMRDANVRPPPACRLLPLPPSLHLPQVRRMTRLYAILCARIQGCGQRVLRAAAARHPGSRTHACRLPMTFPRPSCSGCGR